MSRNVSKLYEFKPDTPETVCEARKRDFDQTRTTARAFGDSEGDFVLLQDTFVESQRRS